MAAFAPEDTHDLADPVDAAPGIPRLAVPKPASAKGVRSYIARAFGDRLAEARGAMEALAASISPAELNRIGFRLYERFRPDVPEGAQGWGAKWELRVERIQGSLG